LLFFELPVFLYSLIKLNVFSKDYLKKKRPYVFVFSFVLGMLLTPPDVVSQIFLSVPIFLLFEFCLFFL